MRVTTRKDGLSGPHTDQVARDILDDHGLVVTYDNVVGSESNMMEVLG